MSATVAEAWPEANQRHLAAALGVVRARLDDDAEACEEAERELDTAAAGLPAPGALDVLCQAFGLSSFEREILLLAAGVELDDGSMPDTARGGKRQPPTFGAALALLPDAHWSALSPGRPLRRWRLVEPAGEGSLTSAPLRIDERVLHFLAGVQYLDERLNGLVEPATEVDELPSSLGHCADRIARVWASTGIAVPPLVQVIGGDAAGRRCVAEAATVAAGLGAFVLDVRDLPAAAAEREALARLWEREAVFGHAALLVLAGEAEPAEPTRPLEHFVETTQAPLVVSGGARLVLGARPVVRVELPDLGPEERVALWSAALGELAPALDGRIVPLSAHFRLGPRSVRTAAATALAATDTDGPEDLAARVWEACVAEGRTGLDDLAKRIEPTADWSDLVLPEAATSTLRQIVAHVRRRPQVHDEWGFAEKSGRGLGVSVLFAGGSGTGKTMAAEVLAKELRLDLYRIDLSRVVSKYIGETEKNLRRVFDSAEAGGAVLLFDEADALFGKRSEVKDSHDRYANIEVSYLLQRMEAYGGLAILTTNMRSALDPAFMRRLRFVVEFPFPGVAERTRIWRGIFPDRAPLEELDFARLARPALAGGNIRNVAFGGAFLAADAGEPVTMAHLRRALEAEYAKLEKPLLDDEIGDWA